RFSRDWSSDVCSSDLPGPSAVPHGAWRHRRARCCAPRPTRVTASPGPRAGGVHGGDTMTETAHAWSALGGDPALLARVTAVERPGVLPARLGVRETARACVGVCALAAAELAARRAGLAEVPAVRVDDG